MILGNIIFSGIMVLQDFQQINFKFVLDHWQTVSLYSPGLHLLRWDVHLVEVEYCDEQPEQQLARATKQHSRLQTHLHSPATK